MGGKSSKAVIRDSYLPLSFPPFLPNYQLINWLIQQILIELLSWANSVLGTGGTIQACSLTALLELSFQWYKGRFWEFLNFFILDTTSKSLQKRVMG